MVNSNTRAQIYPYDHQTLAVDAASDQMRITGAALIVAPTGSGKTVIIGEMIRRQLSSCRVLVLQHMINLVDQNGATITGMNPNRSVAFHCAGSAVANGPHEGANVVIASAQTFQSTDAAAIGAFDMLIIDEAQHVASDQYSGIIRTLRIKRPKMKIFGVTATPERADGKGIASVFGPGPAYTISLRTLIDGGYLVKPVPHTLVLKDVNLAGKAVDGLDARLSSILNTDVTNVEVVQLYQKYGEGRKSIAFCCDVAHAEHLAAAFNAAGITSVAVSHKTRASDFREIVESVKAGTGPQVVCNAQILTEGFDAPIISCMLIVRRYEHKSPFIQACGRGLRSDKARGKTDCIILDYTECFKRHGDLISGDSTGSVDPDVSEHWRDPTRPQLFGERSDRSALTINDLVENDGWRAMPSDAVKVGVAADGSDIFEIAAASNDSNMDGVRATQIGGAYLLERFDLAVWKLWGDPAVRVQATFPRILEAPTPPLVTLPKPAVSSSSRATGRLRAKGEILALLQSLGQLPSSKEKLSAMIGTSKTTTQDAVNELLVAGLIVKVGHQLMATVMEAHHVAHVPSMSPNASLPF